MADLPESLSVEYERIGREREQASKETDRAYRRELLRVCAEMCGWSAIGLVLGGAAFWVGDRQTGFMLLTAGQIVNVGGVAWSIHAAYRRGSERGDW